MQNLSRNKASFMSDLLRHDVATYIYGRLTLTSILERILWSLRNKNEDCCFLLIRYIDE